MIASVIIDILNKQVNRSFDYIIPEHLLCIVKKGYRVKVPFGKSVRLGFVIDIKEETDYSSKLKEIIDVVDVKPILNDEFIDIAKYISDNNFSFYATSLQAMIPQALKIKYQKIAKVINKKDYLKDIFIKDTINLASLDKDKLKIVYDAYKNNDVILDTVLKKKKDTNFINYISILNEEIEPKSKKGFELKNYLIEIEDEIEESILIDDMGYSKAVIDTLIRLGIAKRTKKEIINELESSYELKDVKIDLNEDQNRAFKSVILNYYNTYLLHGITGSGKTEVYLRLIDEVIKQNKSAIMLVPEISLTPQITNIFKARFKSNVAILHSRLTMNQKYNEWKRIYNNDVKIVIGARSAIFAPLNNLGIIIIDEEHENSYIQSNNPKYNAIEIAKFRAKRHNAPLILGSATPNVCDYYLATNGEYELISMLKRANGKPLPKTDVVDMKEELKSGNKSVISKSLKEELIKTYKKGEQSILFLNRRGYSSFVMCRNCGETVKCPHCDISLTYHARKQTLECHYCGFSMPNVKKCYNCGSDKIRFVGNGTEKIVEEAYKILPEAKILRVDLDSVSKLIDYEDMFFKFKNKEYDILVGTQMISKGLDFPYVSLVGIVNADLALNYPTYDATAIAYNLIEQVSGRAGRKDVLGKVIIQTYNPEHYVIRCAKNHDYETFFKYEIEKRRLSYLPPFSTLINIMVESKDANKAHLEAKKIIASLKEVSTKSIILGPAEDFIFKRNDKYRFNIQIEVVEDSILDKIKEIYPIYQNNKDISISITRT